MFKKNSVSSILKRAKRKRRKLLSDDLDNILFLDFDGVLNLDADNYGEKPFNSSCVENVNRLCRAYSLKIVVISSWKKYALYEEILRMSGLDPDIVILGKTDTLGKDREAEIKQYLSEHIYIDRFLILDDGVFDELTPYHVQTSFTEGFTDEKYREAVRILENQS